MEGRQRLLRIRFRYQTTAEEILNKTWKLSKKDFKHVSIKRDLSTEKRKRIKELWCKTNEMKLSRTQFKRERYHWKIMNVTLMK